MALVGGDGPNFYRLEGGPIAVTGGFSGHSAGSAATGELQELPAASQLHPDSLTHVHSRRTAWLHRHNNLSRHNSGRRPIHPVTRQELTIMIPPSQKFAVLTAMGALSVAAAGSIPRGVGPDCKCSYAATLVASQC